MSAGCPCTISLDNPNLKGDIYDRTGRDSGERGCQGPCGGAGEDARPAGLVENHAFNSAVRDTFTEATEISDERALEYGDTWNVDRMRDGLLVQTLALPQPPEFHKEFIRLLRCAAIIDIKVSRLSGPWKPDTLTDLVNYQAAYLQWRAEYALATQDATAPGSSPIVR